MAEPWIDDELLQEPADEAGFFMPDDDAEQVAAMAEAAPDLLTDDELGLMDSWTPETVPSEDFGANLADEIDEDYLLRLAQRVIEWVDEDKQAREPWQQREARGMRMLGITDETEGGADFEGASRAVHPLLTLGCVQFQARSIAELWPAGGPAKTIVLGASDEEREKQAARVGSFLNYQYTNLMPGAFQELDRLLMRLPMSGSCFKRVYYDPIEQTVVSRMAEASKVYVPYAATDLVSVPRFTFEFEETTFETRRKQLDGFYSDIELSPPGDIGEDRGTVLEAIDQADGITPVSTREDEDASYTRYESACFLDLPGFEEELPLPYLVTVDKDSQRVLRIQRNWRPTDARKRRRVHLIHYYFIPGFGFYGYGLTHLVGGLASAVTGALRALLDSAYLANMQGGFVTRDARLGKGKTKVQMGQWNEVDVDAESISKAFHPFKYEEPSPALVKMLEILNDLGNSLMTTTENVVGESNNNAPVGTTLALIEQGLKVFSAVHKRLHEAQTQELKLVAELNAEYLPPEYPYLIEGEDQTVFAVDFDERVDVIPVSDPNIVTNTQRIAQAQSVRQLATEAPDLYDRRAVERWMLEVLRVPDIDTKLPDKSQIPRLDPVSEGMAMMTNQPTQVFPDQDHMAHIAVHQQVRDALPPEMMDTVTPIIDAHIAEHYAQLYKAQMALQMGVELPQPGQETDPETEAQLAQAAAMVPQIVMPARPMQSDPAGEAKAKATEADIARKDKVAESDIARKDAQSQAAMQQQAQQAEMDQVNQMAKDMLEEVKARREAAGGAYGAPAVPAAPPEAMPMPPEPLTLMGLEAMA